MNRKGKEFLCCRDVSRIGTAGAGKGAATSNKHLEAPGRVFLLVNLPLLILLIDITLEFENVIRPGEKLDFPLLIRRMGSPARLGQRRRYKTLPVKPKMGRGNGELSFRACTLARNKNPATSI